MKHATASAFVFGRFPTGWRLGLIHHPRLGRRMIMGGHVEQDESQEQAVLREVVEESGLSARLLDDRVRVPMPLGYPHPQVALPWWINEMPVPADSHLVVPHVHIDHQYVAVADDPHRRSAGEHAFGWHGEDELADLPLFEDTRLLAEVLFTYFRDRSSEWTTSGTPWASSSGASSASGVPGSPH